MQLDQVGSVTGLHCCRVYIAESKRRGNQPFAFTLLEWAGNARRRAMCGQRRLFA